mmetsp:Transcript_15226/g.45779  ORF Transcript_15226/g.45779 Transcript_15226/m.45779 type:complete len:272 (-) Transcript_15226:1853-2668(-)
MVDPGVTGTTLSSSSSSTWARKRSAISSNVPRLSTALNPFAASSLVSSSSPSGTAKRLKRYTRILPLDSKLSSNTALILRFRERLTPSSFTASRNSSFCTARPMAVRAQASLESNELMMAAPSAPGRPSYFLRRGSHTSKSSSSCSAPGGARSSFLPMPRNPTPQPDLDLLLPSAPSTSSRSLSTGISPEPDLSSFLATACSSPADKRTPSLFNVCRKRSTDTVSSPSTVIARMMECELMPCLLSRRKRCFRRFSAPSESLPAMSQPQKYE